MLIKRIASLEYIKNLFLFSLFTLIFLLVRNLVEDNTKYNFLLWNLFLGFLPFVFALVIQVFEKKLNNILFWLGTFVWLLFYPNAPYMITDLIHVEAATTNLLYDTLLIFTFSMLSLFFGFYSIKLMQLSFKSRLTPKVRNSIILFSLLLSSFGIYLGRIVRLNSWDVFTQPMKTLELIFQHLFPLSANSVTYVVTILFTFIQIFLLLLMEDIDEI